MKELLANKIIKAELEEKPLEEKLQLIKNSKKIAESELLHLLFFATYFRALQQKT